MAVITALATALPPLDYQEDFRRWARARVAGTRTAKLYDRMDARSGIAHRWSVLSAQDAALDQGRGFYGDDADPPGTAARMRLYAKHAPDLAMQAIAGLPDTDGITHLVVASCTGFVAPGIDQIVAQRLRLGADVERVLIGFMGCYAAVTALRTARHIVRSDPAARVLVVTVELSSLHHRAYDAIEPLMAVSQFGDGAAAAIVAREGAGMSLDSGLSLALAQSEDLIRWDITDHGFEMHLSGKVPGRIAAALNDAAVRDTILGGNEPSSIDGWAVHAGGRSILDAVQRGLGLAEDALDASRGVLHDCGNMSSATLMFVLARLMERQPARGIALAFGPGLAVEGLRFGWTGG